VTTQAALIFWIGHYRTWAESVANERCEISDASLNRVWDAASGVELTSQDRRSRALLLVGTRVDDAERPLETSRGATTQFYRENYVRYEAARALGGPFLLELQGWHRRRLGPAGGPLDAYYQGEHSTGLSFGDLSLVSGVEFDTDPGTPDLYFNGQVRYAVTRSLTVALFAGQRRGGLRCVSGVCRIFPPFEGGRLDVTWRL
jgi:hypothetical protein